ncbi:MAG: hypothetical protein LBI56_03845 [Puniceicoccales bacterium]|jgi:hypothetical protein|nr:hypothetical protein [Puniceicoccales bacterium]
MKSGSRRSRIARKAFTLLEVVLSLLLITTIVFFGKKFSDISADNVRSLEEIKMVDGELNSLLAGIRSDLGSTVLLGKNQPAFEIRNRDEGNGFDMFFFTTNNEKHITMAVKYGISNLEFGNIEIQRTLLSDLATLELQNALSSGISFEKFFANVSSSQKQIRKCILTLSDFRVRLAIKNFNGKIIFFYPNMPVIYFPGALIGEKSDEKFTLPGNLLFVDVTARAFLKSDAAKFNSLKVKNASEAREFLFFQSRKSFGRITFNAMSF